MDIFVNRLVELRKNNNYKQTDVAEASKVSYRQYQSYEAGKAEPKLTTLIALADFFDVSLDYLVGRSDKKD
ncbi:helix-turn-helix domain-containing protein [Lactococcus petauri]|uniref:helix-turn-helix domain-containing protein n=1 Tax=Lactococcus petauri TaxID=1940789 RepID=UPI001F5725BF|nr:helix-turn-helix transcriptional regulator [Lactococcus petauri]